MGVAIDEADVLFDIFLPLAVQSHASAIQNLGGTVRFIVQGQERHWAVEVGRPPWVFRGEGPVVEAEPVDVTVEIAMSLIEAVVQGRDWDLTEAMKSGAIRANGNQKVLDRFANALGDGLTLSQLLTTR